MKGLKQAQDYGVVLPPRRRESLRFPQAAHALNPLVAEHPGPKAVKLSTVVGFYTYMCIYIYIYLYLFIFLCVCIYVYM